MQSLRRAAQLATAQLRAAGRRGMATTEPSAEAQWANYYPRPKGVTPEAAKKNLRKEMAGFLLLGPAAAGFMLYDLVIGLEEEEDMVIPPYPWMRIRRVPGMPWGEDSLFEYHNHVAKEWPPAEGLPEKGAGHHH